MKAGPIQAPLNPIYEINHSEAAWLFVEDGLLVFADRKKDMIKTGGENVPTIKVEEVLLDYPKVENAAVVGLPHERWSEAITAFVKATDSTRTEEEIKDRCRKELADFEEPKSVIYLDEFPRTATGKVQKFKLTGYYLDYHTGKARVSLSIQSFLILT